MIDYRLFGIKPSRVISSYCYSVFRLEPYIGCRYDCIYCYARWYRLVEPLASIDKLLLYWEKVARRLSQTSLPKPYFRLSTLTEPFQEGVEDKIFASYKMLEIAYRYRIPVVINTKSTLFLRDPWISLINKLADEKLVLVQVSIGLRDDGLAKLLEPGAPPPTSRLEAIDKLYEQGIPVVLRLQPLIPGLEDEHFRVLREALSTVKGVIIESLRLPWNILVKLYDLLSSMISIGFDPSIWTKYTVEARDLYTPIKEWKSRMYSMVKEETGRAGIPLTTCKDYPLTMTTDCCLFWVTGNREYGVRETIRERKYGLKPSHATIIGREMIDKYPNPIRKILRLHSNKLDKILMNGTDPLREA